MINPIPSSRLRRNILWPTVGLLLGLLGALAVSVALPKTYQASATVLINVPGGTPDGKAVQAIAPTIARLLSSGDLAAAVAKHMGVPEAEVAGNLSGTFVPGESFIEVGGLASSSAAAANLANGATEVLPDQSASLLGLEDRAITMTVVDPAESGGAPVFPKTGLNLLLGATLGLLAGLAVNALRDRLDTRLHEPEDVTVVMAAPIIGGWASPPSSATESSSDLAAVNETLAALTALVGTMRAARVAIAGTRNDDGADLVFDQLAQGIRLSSISLTAVRLAEGQPVPANRPLLALLPPVLASVAFAEAAEQFDAVLLVVTGGATSRSDALQASELTRRSGVATVAIVTIGVSANMDPWPTASTPTTVSLQTIRTLDPLLKENR